MKNKEHKKTKESLIGKIIYSFLLFLPLIAILSTIIITTFNKNVTLDNNAQNVFYYAITQLENSDLFNWTTNSVIYTTLSATTSALSIDNTFIPMLLTYWLITSVLYFLYDIVLMILNILHRKIHELQESI